MQKEIEEACRDTRGVSPEELQEGFGPACQSTIPTKASVKFVRLSLTLLFIINIIII